MRGLLPATERLWSALKEQRVLAGFTLIGGSALTLRIGHRISEDLDFVWITDPGYEALMDSPPSRDELRTFFASFRNEYEIESSARAVSMKPSLD